MKRGRPPAHRALTLERIVGAAMEVLGRHGLDGLTMRGVADVLGIQAASLYNHVRAKDELLALMADALCAEMRPRAGAPRQELESIALEQRRVLRSRRDAARVLASTPPVGPHRLALVERALLAMERLAPGRTADAAACFNSYVVGFLLDESAGQEAPAGAGVDADQYPTFARLSGALRASPGDRRFLLGLRALLDGLSRTGPAQRRRRPARSAPRARRAGQGGAQPR